MDTSLVNFQENKQKQDYILSLKTRDLPNNEKKNVQFSSPNCAHSN